MGNKLSASDKHHVKEAFDYFDLDSDGSLTLDELQVLVALLLFLLPYYNTYARSILHDLHNTFHHKA